MTKTAIHWYYVMDENQDYHTQNEQHRDTYSHQISLQARARVCAPGLHRFDLTHPRPAIESERWKKLGKWPAGFKMAAPRERGWVCSFWRELKAVSPQLLAVLAHHSGGARADASRRARYSHHFCIAAARRRAAGGTPGRLGGGAETLSLRGQGSPSTSYRMGRAVTAAPDSPGCYHWRVATRA